MPSVTLMNNETAESLKSVIEKGSVEELLGPELEKVPWEAVVRGRITRDTVEELSKIKGEPDWMRRLRLRALEMFEKLPEPKWLPIKEEIDLESLVTYAKPSIERAKSWDEVPKEIRRYYEALGLPELEAKVLAGLLGQFDSEVVYLHVKKYLEENLALRLIINFDTILFKFQLPIFREFKIRPIRYRKIHYVNTYIVTQNRKIQLSFYHLEKASLSGISLLNKVEPFPLS